MENLSNFTFGDLESYLEVNSELNNSLGNLEKFLDNLERNVQNKEDDNKEADNKDSDAEDKFDNLSDFISNDTHALKRIDALFDIKALPDDIVMLIASFDEQIYLGLYYMKNGLKLLRGLDFKEDIVQDIMTVSIFGLYNFRIILLYAGLFLGRNIGHAGTNNKTKIHRLKTMILELEANRLYSLRDLCMFQEYALINSTESYNLPLLRRYDKAAISLAYASI